MGVAEHPATFHSPSGVGKGGRGMVGGMMDHGWRRVSERELSTKRQEHRIMCTGMQGWIQGIPALSKPPHSHNHTHV